MKDSSLKEKVVLWAYVLVLYGVVISCCFKTALGMFISRDCLYKICSPYAAYSSPFNCTNRVSRPDSSTVNYILRLQPLSTADNGFYCSSDVVMTFRGLIKCNCSVANRTLRVAYIDFSNMNLNGTLPNSIGKLTYLYHFYLSICGVENKGDEIFQVSLILYCEIIYMPQINNIPNWELNDMLVIRDLSGNQLSGLIPPSLTNLTQLSYLNLCYNNLEGPIPAFNGTNKALQSLYLCSNRLNGSIPEGLGQLSSLLYLKLQDNQIHGWIPKEMGNLKSLEQLYLRNNNFSGELPESIGELKKLRYINFNGNIPDAIGQLPALRSLWLGGNNFSGPLPKAFSSQEIFSLTITDVSGGGRGNSFPDLRSLKNLKFLTLRNCSLTGSIPTYIGQLVKLTQLDLSFNELSGDIPLSWPKNFSTLFLRSNKLNGSLPSWAFNGTNGINVDVSDNRLFNNATVFPNGTISSDKNLFACCINSSDVKNKWLDVNYQCENDFAKFDRVYINCGGNDTYIDGNYYESDLNPDGRSTFVLSNNSAWGYSSMGSYIYASNDQYVFSQTCNVSNIADAPLYTGARVAPISLKYYAFCLRNDNYTVRLDFAEIGWDPASILQGRRVFNVDIQGKRALQDFNIEEQAKGIYRNVSREFPVVVDKNKLEIHFYWSGKGSISVPLYYGPLISAIAVSAVPKPPKRLSALSIGAIAGSSFIFVGLILALLWMFGLIGGNKTKKDGVELYPGGIFNFQEIKTATNNFDATKKIGHTGNVYKGMLTDSTEVAVKQLSVKSKQETHQIINEIGMIYALQHPNIAKPMGCCVKERQVLLVYNYMENISLQHVLFDSDDEEVRSKLNWRARFKIILGMAKGLAFLHEESKLDIIHSNIKPTNILLDKDFNVRISDFRYSELHDGQSNKEETTFRNMPRAKDTGHMAPEYMQGLPLTPKADVYSFGLVTLEIISGLPHIIVKAKEDIQLLNTAYKYHEEGCLEALIETKLNQSKDYKHNEVVTILYLAMQCVSPSFDLRPAMSEVVQILEGKKKFKGKRINPSPVIESSPNVVTPTSESSAKSELISEDESSTIN
ncbi:OLC1v1014057C1 [Oldenlandia corymbosa var. corymbosa]|nr:OLC1v1014057C1 [Oldenlandia corymbosa var. corymbosa]